MFLLAKIQALIREADDEGDPAKSGCYVFQMFTASSFFNADSVCLMNYFYAVNLLRALEIAGCVTKDDAEIPVTDTLIAVIRAMKRKIKEKTDEK